MDRVLASALLNSELRDGELAVQLNDSTLIQALAWELRVALLEEKIPHYKVVGALVNSGASNLFIDYVTKCRGSNRSYAELYAVFNDVVFAESGGLADIGVDRSLWDVGAEDPLGYITGFGKTITTSNGSLVYSGAGASSKVRSLIPDVHLIDFESMTSSIQLIIARGTEMLDFDELGFSLKETKFVPIRAVFDLNRFIAISPILCNRKIRFTYKYSNLDESVLGLILKDYAKQFLTENKEAH